MLYDLLLSTHDRMPNCLLYTFSKRLLLLITLCKKTRKKGLFFFYYLKYIFYHLHSFAPIFSVKNKLFVETVSLNRSTYNITLSFPKRLNGFRLKGKTNYKRTEITRNSLLMQPMLFSCKFFFTRNNLIEFVSYIEEWVHTLRSLTSKFVKCIPDIGEYIEAIGMHNSFYLLIHCQSTLFKE